MKQSSKIPEADIEYSPLPKQEIANPVQNVADGVSEVNDGFLQSPNFKAGANANGWRLNGDGRANFTDITIANTLMTVSVGQNIQDAINKISTSGGGTIQLDAGTYSMTSGIVLASNVSIVGSGKNVTILDFNNLSYGISASSKQNILLSNFTVKNNGAGTAVSFDTCSEFRVVSVSVMNAGRGIYCGSSSSFSISYCDTYDADYGFRVDSSSQFSLENCVADTSATFGFYFYGASSGSTCSEFNLLNCKYACDVIGTTNTGFYFGTYAYRFSVLGGGVTSSTFNTDYAYHVVGAFGTFINCTVGGLAGTGVFYVQGNANTFIGCHADFSSNSTTYEDFQITGWSNALIACGGTTEFLVSGQTYPNTMIGQSFFGTSDSEPSGLFKVGDSWVHSTASQWNSPKVEKKIMSMKNTSGGALAVGDTVVFKTGVASGNEMTTTTTAGDSYVFGMILETSSTNEWTEILREGYTTALKVNGTTDIAVGDFLSTYTVAGIAGKASAGHTVFAIALEAYTGNDSNGVIDALLIAPRLI
jgi:hypothetical protein